MSINADRYSDPIAGTDTGAANERPEESPSGDGAANGVSASQTAARLLEATARETDHWRSEAKSEAAAIVANARAESAALVRTAREEAEDLLSQAREECAQMTNDARVEAYRVREETTALRKRHEEDVARLQQVATENRERLRISLTEMLDQVSSLGEGGQ